MKAFRWLWWWSWWIDFVFVAKIYPSFQVPNYKRSKGRQDSTKDSLGESINLLRIGEGELIGVGDVPPKATLESLYPAEMMAFPQLHRGRP